MQQLSLTFEPGLAQRSRCLRDHVAGRVYQRGLVRVAGELDLSPSKLTEKLAGCDSGGKVRGMTLDEIEAYIERTGDVSPVYYLVDKFLRDPALAQQEALARIGDLIREFPALAQAAGLDSAARKPRRAGR